jgi:hypothetical protein
MQYKNLSGEIKHVKLANRRLPSLNLLDSLANDSKSVEDNFPSSVRIFNLGVNRERLEEYDKVCY